MESTLARFADRVVLVTGAGSGIGAEAAARFAAEGGRVACCDVDIDTAKKTVQRIANAGGNAQAVRLDVRDERSVGDAVDEVVETFGGLDVAFNNAGINGFQSLHTLPVESWDEMFDVNVRGVFLCMKHELPYLIDRGGGAIVLTGSAIQHGSRPGAAAYSASKHALVGLAQAAALEYAPHGIRVNIIAPGTTDTTMVRRMSGVDDNDPRWPELRTRWGADRMPGMRRMGDASEIAAAVLMLASADASFITGTTLFVDGGLTAAL